MFFVDLARGFAFSQEAGNDRIVTDRLSQKIIQALSPTSQTKGKNHNSLNDSSSNYDAGPDRSKANDRNHPGTKLLPSSIDENPENENTG